MGDPSSSAHGGQDEDNADGTSQPTVAAFSPSSHSFSTKQRSTILVHQKSPLLLATPPQVTRALAYSHPFVVPLNKLAGLLSWTTGDPWESFLFVALFWFTTLYGDYALRYGGPFLLLFFLMLGMYTRRYSPLSSTGWRGEKHAKTHTREPSDVHVRHRKSLDEILATLQTFTTRCNILLDPLLRLTDYLSTQQTATSATTRPALTALFIRILLAAPVWIALTLPPFHIITTKRIVLVFGTVVLSWHSRPARITRTILWRSQMTRRVCSTLTGLTFKPPLVAAPPLPPRRNDQSMPTNAAAISAMKRNNNTDEGIRFSFSLYENQRRWLGLGWTPHMLAYERATWTDEYLNPTADSQHFTLPDVEGGMAKWRWVEGSEWKVDGGSRSAAKGTTASKAADPVEDEDEWVFYDNKWRDGHRGQDGWGKYTRRRKWIRDAELIDVVPEPKPEDIATPKAAASEKAAPGSPSAAAGSTSSGQASTSGLDNAASPKNRKGWFAQSPKANQGRNSPRPRGNSGGSTSASVTGSFDSSSRSTKSRAALEEEDVLTPAARLQEHYADYGLGDDSIMGLG